MFQPDAQLEQGAMPENNQNQESHNMESLLQQEGLGIDFPAQGEIRTGMIASLSPGQILVSVGTKSEGVITGKEFEAIPQAELAALKVGQEIPVYVVNPEDQGGNLVLSYVRAREEVSWQQAEKMKETAEAFHGTIIGYNKGGLIVPLGSLRGFVPASQISLSRRVALSGDTPEQKWSKMIGEPIDVRVIEVDRERRRLILSERAASTETRESLKERVIEELKEGEIRTGRVTSLADFGAFVNISGADGLVHLSEISWERIQHPSEVLKVGQEVKVKIISIDREKRRIGLSIRALQADPWSQQVSHLQVGQLVEGKITRLTKFGSFARLEGDMEGLIHISEISEKRIEHPKEVLHEGDVVTLRVIKIDIENHRIGLSLRKVDSMAYADMDFQVLEGEIEGGSASAPAAAPETASAAVPETALAGVPETAPETATATVPSTAPAAAPETVPETAHAAAPKKVPSTAPAAAPKKATEKSTASAPATVPSTAPAAAPETVPSTAHAAAPKKVPSTATAAAPATVPSTAHAAVPKKATEKSPAAAPATVPSTAHAAAPKKATEKSPSTAHAAALKKATATAPAAVPETVPAAAPETDAKSDEEN